MSVLPVHISFMRWASQIRNDFPDISIPVAESEDTWRDWASQLIHGNNLSNVPLPDKISYPRNEDWSTWAAYFINGVYNFTPKL